MHNYMMLYPERIDVSGEQVLAMAKSLYQFGEIEDYPKDVDDAIRILKASGHASIVRM